MASTAFAVVVNPKRNEPSRKRIDRLDALRFVAAVWVAISHGALPLRTLFADPICRVIAGAIESTFSGVSAVMVFFIISGLCIHLPYAESHSIPGATFLIRRYVRIGVPLIVVMWLAPVVGDRAVSRNGAVLWSVYAELVYYSIYPILFYAARRWGWGSLIISSGGASVWLTAANASFTNVQQFGWLTWLWGLPIWLSGCFLAEASSRGALPNIPGSVHLWRAGAWLGGAAATFALFHSPVRLGDPITMSGFSVLAYCWISKELQDKSPTWPWMRNFGAASYSLYLTHSVVLGGFEEHIEAPTQMAELLFRIVGVAIGAYAFYKIVEAPSHSAARRLARAAPLNVILRVERRMRRQTGRA